MQGAADDQGHCDGIGVHHQNMLEPERKKLRQRQYFVDRMDGCAGDGLAPEEFDHGKIPALDMI
jgi:hypothetical protein